MTKDIYSLLLVRSIYTPLSASGDLFINGKWFCYTLEDCIRPLGVKVDGKTAIPEGHYEVILNMSARFKKIMPLVQNVKGFTGVRIHGGNTSENTEGCPLVAYSRKSSDRIEGSASEDLLNLLKQQKIPMWLTVINKTTV